MAKVDFGPRPTTLLEFVEGADAHFHTTRNRAQQMGSQYRIGQAYSNYLDYHFPERAARIRYTNTDPFYNNENLGRFMAYVVKSVVRA